MKKLEYFHGKYGNVIFPPKILYQKPKPLDPEFIKQKSEWRKRVRRKIILNTNLKLSSSKELNGLEKAGNALLDALCIKYKTQVPICGNLVDVFIPLKNIVIQWDGDYWHGLKTGGIVRNRNRAKSDRAQDDYMRQFGYTVIRFWEHEVHKQKDMVAQKIKELAV